MKRAFTLVEMLVAVVLLTLLIGVAIFAFRYQAISIAKMKKLGIEKVLHYNQLTSPIESIKYYIVDSYDTLGNPMQNLHPYFYGTSKEIDFITTNPIYSKQTSLAKLECKNNQILYSEEKLFNHMNFLKPSLGKDSRSIILYKDIKLCSFKYLYRGNSIRELKDNIPTKITIEFQYRKKPISYIVNVMSDYNQSEGIINEAIYPTE